MRIALTADPELPVPPELYGGIERVVDLLAQGLDSRGHEVSVFAHRDSRTAGELIPWPGRSSRSAADTVRNASLLTREAARRRFDLIHSFSRIAYLTPLLPMPIPKIMTYQRPISPRSVRLGHTLSNGTLGFTAISRWMIRNVMDIGRWSVVPNCVSLEKYEFRSEVAADAPLVFLGRVEEIKGPHLAIEIARRLDRPLVIAGNVPREKQSWFEAHVAPHIDGGSVRYVGPVDDAAKNALLGSARALLMPILWDEPFGIVMAEAMACGTPVLALARGAALEVVEDGVTGFVRDDVEALVESAESIDTIDRSACRRRTEALYAAPVVVQSYVEIYRQAVSTNAG